MGVRRITLQEYEKADQIKRVAFLRTTREEAKNEADRPEEIFESIWAYFDDDERMTARVRNIDYTMFFDGQKVRMGGISAVSSCLLYTSCQMRFLKERLFTATENIQVFSSAGKGNCQG